MFGKIIYEVKDRIAFVTLNNGKMNPIDADMAAELVEAYKMIEVDEDVKASVIRGGERAFSAGGDANNMSKGLKDGTLGPYRQRIIENLNALTLMIKKSAKPVIASVQGPAAGAGFNLALACDMCIAAENVKFVPAFAKLGLIPDTGGIGILTKLFSLNKVLELSLLAKPMGAQEAYNLGVVCEVCAVEELEEKTLTLANTIAGNSALTNKYIKALAYECCFKDLEDYMEKEHKYLDKCTDGDDFKEGVAALVEKRPAQFK